MNKIKWLIASVIFMVAVLSGFFTIYNTAVKDNGLPQIFTNILDGQAPVTSITSCPFNVGTTYSTGYYDIADTALTTACTANLPTAVAGLVYCIDNGYAGGVVSGPITIQTSAVGQYIIYTDGTLSASDGYVVSLGAGGDKACVRGVDSTHWMLYLQGGSWTKH